MKRRLLGAATAVVMSVGLIAGCSSNSSGNTDGGKVTLKLGMWASSPAEKKLVDKQIAAFEKANPNIKVKEQVITGDYLQALQPMLASKTAPDIFYVDASYAPTLEDSGVLAELDDYIKKEKVDTSDFAPAALEAFQWKGKTYGLPKDYNTMALEYNKDLFAKAGISEPPKTWDELIKDAEILKSKGIAPLSMPIDVARYYPFITEFGGSYYDSSANKVTLDDSSNVAGLKFFLDNIHNKNIVPPKDLGGDWAGVPFSQGKVAMALEGAWVLPFMADSAPNVKFGISDFPSADGKSGNMTYTVSYSMAKSTKHPKEAAKLLFFMTGKEAEKMTADSGLAIPSRVSQQSAFLDKNPEYQAFVNGIKSATPYQFGTYGQNFVDAINKATEQGALKGLSPEKVLKQAQQTVESQSQQ
ncbi:ABC transporter substrate-binding protein [Heyndrickxia shackletonii]|uniref:ABC transporter substrate-binding protein n=1 Tax=Heyndrickxia shackletonii TaxID=157838 RepID=A0A0Q3TG95_9BACI|nr:ABC transporter substrate-binding protein [Heyndrickxia shackletonii]KQL53022.1 ABC transporter substrate-binding protein [Heyndrickxia shackletonii]NEY98574.1 ABC transporter substrate-binding protein [Heyndrickxia shackletonii]